MDSGRTQCVDYRDVTLFDSILLDETVRGRHIINVGSNTHVMYTNIYTAGTFDTHTQNYKKYIIDYFLYIYIYIIDNNNIIYCHCILIQYVCLNSSYNC